MMNRIKQFIQRMKEWKCATIGHSFDDMDQLVYQLEINALNARQLDSKLTCQCCGVTFVPIKND